MTTGEDPHSHRGEVLMRDRYPGPYWWDSGNLPRMVQPRLSPSMIRFIENLPFFFVATASDRGHCDASFRGRDYDAAGRPLPALRAPDPQTVIFPDFRGNGLYQSLGNILTNPQIGLLFMDFDRQRRARVNGRASILPPPDWAAALWPAAQSVVQVEVQQAFGNCAARIPRMRLYEGSDAPFS
ncbi:pyridoxamine 5'-phosphate oxidase [Paracoccus sp. M683]|nr:pyridoxamine 5'-phosphate oxidase [Paracoccus sp. M683]